MKQRRSRIITALAAITFLALVLWCFNANSPFQFEGDAYDVAEKSMVGVIYPTEYEGNRTGTKIMVFARKRSGSSMTGEFFSRHPDCFYFYEPGRIVAEHASKIGAEQWGNLEDFRPQLLSFLDGIYSCNFTNDEYMSDLNNIGLYRQQGQYPQGNITMASISDYCTSKMNTVTKVLRLYNIFLAAPLLSKYDIKVIHLVRDPRGMVKSREMFRNNSKVSSTPGEIHITHKLEEEIKDYCRWLETNYLVSRHAPDWFRNNYFVVRYEDIVQHPWRFVPKMYEFAGLPTDDIMRKITNEIIGIKPDNAEAWRAEVTFENVKKLQQLCPTRVWKTFGYKLVNSPAMLKDDSTSLVAEMNLNRKFDYKK